MSTNDEDESIHWKARVDQIPERPEATPERAAISEEIILTDGVDLENWRNEITRLRAIIAERDATIAGLRNMLGYIARFESLDPGANLLVETATQALRGLVDPDAV